MRRVLAGAGDHPSAGKWKVESGKSRFCREEGQEGLDRRRVVWASVGIEGFRMAEWTGRRGVGGGGGRVEGVDRMKGVRAGGGGGLEEARKIRGIGIADRVGWSLVGGGGARASRRPATTVFDGWGVVLLLDHSLSSLFCIRVLASRGTGFGGQRPRHWTAPGQGEREQRGEDGVRAGRRGGKRST